MDRMFLAIDGVDGESRDANHRDEIDVLSWSWGVDADDGSSRGGGRRSRRAAIDDLVIEKRIDAASPHLIEGLLDGKVYSDAALSVERANGDGAPTEFLRIEMSNVTVDEVNEAGDESDHLEQVALRFSKMVYRYVPVAPDGSEGSPITFEKSLG